MRIQGVVGAQVIPRMQTPSLNPKHPVYAVCICIMLTSSVCL